MKTLIKIKVISGIAMIVTVLISAFAFENYVTLGIMLYCLLTMIIIDELINACKTSKVKYKIIEPEVEVRPYGWSSSRFEYLVMYKEDILSKWKYVKRYNDPTLITRWRTEEGAQAYINQMQKK